MKLKRILSGILALALVFGTFADTDALPVSADFYGYGEFEPDISPDEAPDEPTEPEEAGFEPYYYDEPEDCDHYDDGEFECCCEPEPEPVCYDEDGNIIDPPNLIPQYDPDYEAAPAAAKLPYFNLADKGYVTEPKSQRSTGTCWAHAACAAAESNMIMQGLADASIDYSEAHLSYFTMIQPPDEDCPIYGDKWRNADLSNYSDKGGDFYDIAGTLASWSGVELEKNFPISIAIKKEAIPENKRFSSYAHFEEGLNIDLRDRDAVKEILVTNGSCVVPMTWYDDYYNKETASYYWDGARERGHAVTLVGWDDNYSKENFLAEHQPPADGAWILKNSWGTSWGNNGYFYKSYYDTSYSMIHTVKMAKTDNYVDNYQYDGCYDTTKYIGTIGYMKQANIFTGKTRKPLSAVGFYTGGADQSYTVSIYKNVNGDPDSGTLAHTQSGVMRYAGYHTLKLDKRVPISAGERFSVVLTLNNDFSSELKNYNYVYTDRYYFGEGTSYMSLGSDAWHDNAEGYYKSGSIPLDGNNCIKAFTTPNPKLPALKATPAKGQVILSWDSVPDTEFYYVYTYADNKQNMIDKVTSTSYTITGLENGTEYGFLVLAYDGLVFSSWWSGSVVYATPGVPKPELIKSKAGAGQITVTCSGVKGAKNYRLFYTTDNGTTYKKVGDTTARKWEVKNLKSSVEYKFLVLVNDGQLWSSYKKGECYAPAVPTVPKPAIVKSTAGAAKAVVTCSAVKGAVNYRLFYTADNGKSYKKAGDTPDRKWTVKNLKSSVEYKFLVLAYDGKNWSKYSKGECSAPAVPTVPKPATVKSAAGVKKAIVTCSAVKGAKNYRLFYTTDNGRTYKKVGDTPDRKWTVKNLKSGVEYKFLVLAYDGKNWSKYSKGECSAAVKPK